VTALRTESVHSLLAGSRAASDSACPSPRASKRERVVPRAALHLAHVDVREREPRDAGVAPRPEADGHVRGRVRREARMGHAGYGSVETSQTTRPVPPSRSPSLTGPGPRSKCGSSGRVMAIPGLTILPSATFFDSEVARRWLSERRFSDPVRSPCPDGRTATAAFIDGAPAKLPLRRRQSVSYRR
jgi:hypothetical protein